MRFPQARVIVGGFLMRRFDQYKPDAQAREAVQSATTSLACAAGLYIFAFGLAAFCLLAGEARGQDHGLKLLSGFRATLFADADLANDIYAMTLDPQGRVVVTSRGWVKRLDDTDGDGKADRATILVETKSGGMGMCFDDTWFLMVSDGELKQFRYYDGATPLLKPEPAWFPLRFGEHGGHAIRKGPDGAFYVVGGNDAAIASVPKLTVPVPGRRAEAGGIIRFRGSQSD